MPQNASDTIIGFYHANENIGANYYPELVEYSSADSCVVEKHVPVLLMVQSHLIGSYSKSGQMKIIKFLYRQLVLDTLILA